MKHDKKISMVATTEDRKVPLMDLQIDANLRRIYSEKLSEPLPDKLAHVLEQLRQQGRIWTGRSGVAAPRERVRRKAPNLHVVASLNAR